MRLRMGGGFGMPRFGGAKGEVQGVAHKCLLPTYDVFDEDRYFESAAEPTIFTHSGKRIGVTICEDIWTGPVVETSRHYRTDPVGRLAEAGVDLVVNLSASPWHYGKDSTRLAIVGGAARRAGCPLVYVNAIGGNDELIFDGHSMVVRADGTVCAGLGGFTEATAVVDVFFFPRPPKPTRDFSLTSWPTSTTPSFWVCATMPGKSGFRSALVGLSGGIDSALTAALAKEALGAGNVLGVSLPSSISSQHSRDDAAALARNLGIRYETLPIADVVAAAESTLAPLFTGRPRDVTEENIQARARGLLLMALSNKTGALLLTTGNKSEIAVGYCTLYGDMAGGARSDFRFAQNKGLRALPMAQSRPGDHSLEHHHEAPLGGAAAGSKGRGQPAALRRARCHSAPLRRAGRRHRRHRRAGLQ